MRLVLLDGLSERFTCFAAFDSYWFSREEKVVGGTDSRASPKPQRQRTLDDDAVQTTTKPDNSKAFEVHGVGPVFFHNCQQASEAFLTSQACWLLWYNTGVRKSFNNKKQEKSFPKRSGCLGGSFLLNLSRLRDEALSKF